jgi:hypothetical protein
LNLTGELQTAGKLQVVLINPGFTPALGDQFDLLNAPAIGGQFSSISLPALSTGLSWDSSQLYSSRVISVVPEPATATLTGLGGAVVALASLFARRRRISAGHSKPDRPAKASSAGRRIGHRDWEAIGARWEESDGRRRWGIDAAPSAVGCDPVCRIAGVRGGRFGKLS